MHFRLRYLIYCPFFKSGLECFSTGMHFSDFWFRWQLCVDPLDQLVPVRDKNVILVIWYLEMVHLLLYIPYWTQPSGNISYTKDFAYAHFMSGRGSEVTIIQQKHYTFSFISWWNKPDEYKSSKIIWISYMLMV